MNHWDKSLDFHFKGDYFVDGSLVSAWGAIEAAHDVCVR
jgi:hypothetical protein